MDQRDCCIRDYKKWLAFNNELTDQQEVLNLYNAIQKTSTSGNYVCENLLDHGKIHFLIKHPSLNSLLIDDHERELLLAYLRTHYLQTGDTRQTIKTAEKSIGLDNIRYEANDDPQMDSINFSNSHFFLNYNIAFHAIGYALVAITIMQILILPQFTGAHFAWFVQVLALPIIAIISHAGVRLYKKHFLASGIQYVTVAKITIGIFGLTFSALAFEVMLYQIFSGDGAERTLGVAVAGAGIFILGLISGWIFSLPLYFINAGKRQDDANHPKDKHSEKLLNR